MKVFLDDVVSVLVAANVGVYGSTIFIGAKASLPVGDAAFLTLSATGGAPPIGTHNSTAAPAYVRPSAQVVARSIRLAPAESMADAAYRALFGIRNRFINGTWWVKLVLRQEPFELGEDENGRPRVAFNFECEKRLSPLES